MYDENTGKSLRPVRRIRDDTHFWEALAVLLKSFVYTANPFCMFSFQSIECFMCLHGMYIVVLLLVC